MTQDESKDEIKKMHLETLRQIIWGRYNIIFTTSPLVAAVLVIATFNPQLMPLSPNTTKILVIILLTLIPISLVDYSLKLSRDANHVLTALNKINELEIKLPNKKNWFQKIWDGSSYLYVGAISLIIIFIIFSILRSF
ncbi:MAG: hypothetical protein WCX97_04055 [Candidatus Magasanikbacteria bacterium]